MDYLRFAASGKKPPKGYGNPAAGLEVAAYRKERVIYWRRQQPNDCPFTLAERDVIAKYGKPQ